MSSEHTNVDLSGRDARIVADCLCPDLAAAVRVWSRYAIRVATLTVSLQEILDEASMEQGRITPPPQSVIGCKQIPARCLEVDPLADFLVMIEAASQGFACCGNLDQAETNQCPRLLTVHQFTENVVAVWQDRARGILTKALAERGEAWQCEATVSEPRKQQLAALGLESLGEFQECTKDAYLKLAEVCRVLSSVLRQVSDHIQEVLGRFFPQGC